MKTLFLTILFLVGSLYSTHKSSSELDWLTNVDDAIAKAKKQDKPILIYFSGSDWCAPCKLLEEDIVENENFKDLLSQYILVNLDVPRRVDILSKEQMAYNKKMLPKYNKANVFPKLVVLSKRGKIKDEVSGYSSLRDTRPYRLFLTKNK